MKKDKPSYNDLVKIKKELEKQNRSFRLELNKKKDDKTNSHLGIFSQILDSIVIAEVITHRKKVIDFVHKKVNKSYEGLVKQKNIDGKKITELFPKHKIIDTELFEQIVSAYQTNQPKITELFFEPLSIWISVSISFFQEKNFLLIINDITKRKQSEQSLIENEKKFHVLFNNSLDEITISNENGNFVDCNSATLKFHNVSSLEELQKFKTIDAFVNPNDRAEFINEVKKNGYFRNKEIKYKSLNSNLIADCLASTEIMKIDNHEPVFISWFRDITIRKKAEKELEDSTNKLNTIINTLPDLLFHLDINGTILNYYQQENRELYRPPKEFIGKTIYEIFDKELADKIYNAIIQTIRTGHYNHDYDLYINEIKYYSAKYAKLNKNEIIVVIRDITELKKKESELEKLNEDKDRFIQILAHDLKGPFSTILGFTELLLKNIKIYDTETIVKQLSFVNQATDKTYNLLEDILLWSKSQSGKLPFEPQQLYVNEISNFIIYQFKNQAESKEISIEYEEEEKFLVWADVDMLKTILRNLVSNALKFTKPKGKVKISTKRRKEYAIITVTDTGIGIDKNTIDRLWDKTGKISTQGTEGEKGSGFGLTLCKEFVNKHGGRIWVDTILGKGSEFGFSLPFRNSLDSKKNNPEIEI